VEPCDDGPPLRCAGARFTSCVIGRVNGRREGATPRVNGINLSAASFRGRTRRVRKSYAFTPLLIGRQAITLSAGQYALRPFLFRQPSAELDRVLPTDPYDRVLGRFA
jgi:hypothetical protein